jgi:hypothetical protein
MAKRPGVVSHGTARDLADHSVGYSASGESQFSRNAASTGGGRDADQLPDSIKGRYAPDRKSNLIFRNRQEIRKIARKIKDETDPAKLAKLKKNYAIKSMFLAKLERARHEHQPSETTAGPATIGPEPGEISEAWNWETVTEIPGENDFDPF